VIFLGDIMAQKAENQDIEQLGIYNHSKIQELIRQLKSI